jgi:hypothetical protein
VGHMHQLPLSCRYHAIISAAPSCACALLRVPLLLHQLPLLVQEVCVDYSATIHAPCWLLPLRCNLPTTAPLKLVPSRLHFASRRSALSWLHLTCMPLNC